MYGITHKQSREIAIGHNGKERKMKKNIFVAIIISATVIPFSFADSSDNSNDGFYQNPFDEYFDSDRDPRIRPKGLSVFPYSEAENKVIRSNKDKSKLKQSSEDRKNRRARVDKVKDYKNLVRGYQDHDLERKRRFHGKYKAEKKIIERSGQSRKHLYAFPVADLSEFVPVKTDMIFESAGGNYFEDKGWDSITRIIEHKKLGTVIIEEWDFTLSDGGLMMDEDGVNMNIRGNPAIFLILYDDTGATETNLVWADETKSYSIKTNVDVSKKGRMNQFIRLAESLSSEDKMIYPIRSREN